MWFKVKKLIIFHILYIIVAPLCPVFLKRVDFYKAHHSEKRALIGQLSSALWLAEYLKLRRKCYAPYCIGMPCPGVTTQKLHLTAFVCICDQRNDKQQALLYTAQNSCLNSQ